VAAEALGSFIEERKLPGHRAALNGAIKATLRRSPGVSYAPLFDVPTVGRRGRVVQRIRGVLGWHTCCSLKGGDPHRRERVRAFGSVLAVTVALAAAAAGQDTGSAAELEARVWLDRGDEPVLQRGDQVRIYYRTSLDAFTAIFRIDTDGAVRLLSPAHPGGVERTAGDEDYRLLFPEAATTSSSQLSSHSIFPRSALFPKKTVGI
jgi:hypothetical protein